MRNDKNGMDKITTQIRKTMEDLNVLPSKMQKYGNSDKITPGQLILEVETKEPIPDKHPEFNDVDKIEWWGGKEVLRDVPRADVLAALPTLRERVGDRALLRALHFYDENDRVADQKTALLEACAAGDGETRQAALARFFDKVKASGRSSFCYLQNVYTTSLVSEQGLSLCLCLCESVMGGELAAYRVHGGGFAGTVQAWVPQGAVEAFRTLMDGVFGRGATVDLRVRPVGTARIL